MRQYLDLMQRVLDLGEEKSDRTGTGTLSLFGEQMRFDLRDGFPLLTTKKVLFDSLLRELLWFLRGSTNVNDGLRPHTKIWDPWADENGDLGPVYGYQWRNWEQFRWNADEECYEKGHVDQIKDVLDRIQRDPHSRRLIVNAWNVGDLDRMALPPCHMFFQFYVVNGFLDCQLYQRSADLALGVPFNIASYALLMMMVAQECGLSARYFVHTFGDVHLYQNHLDGAREQLTRSPGPLPRVEIADKPFFELAFEDFQLLDYESAPFIKFPIAV